MNSKNGLNTRLINFTTALVAVTLVVYILIVGSSILLPVIVAVIIGYFIIQLIAAFSKIPGTKITIPSPIAAMLSLIATALIIYGLTSMLSNSLGGIISEASRYQARLVSLLNHVNEILPYKINVSQLMQKISLPSLFSNLARSLTNLTGNIVVIIVYVVLLLLEYKTFHSKLKFLCRNEKRYQAAEAITDRVSNDVNIYLKVKTGASLLTALLTYITLLSFGIQYAQFWAVLIFILNFIPTVGSIVAIIITLLAVSIQLTTLSSFFILTGLLVAIQFIVGNLIEPRFMGKSLNLSPLVILIALAFWGAIWGVLGMLLCVPLMTILNIVLAKFESTRAIPMLLSANPEACGDDFK